MVSLKTRNCEICVNPLCFVIELAAIFFLMKAVPFFSGLGMSNLDFMIVSLLILVGSLVSLCLHESAHFWAARWMDLPVRGITISMFGAYTSFDSEPSTPKEAFVVSMAGPLINILAGFVFYVCHLAFQHFSILAGTAFLSIAVFNGIFSAYNLLPVMPLDGALVVRAAFWRASRNQVWSTRVSFNIGNCVVLICLIAGMVNIVIFKLLISAVFFILGISLWQTERLAYQQMMSAKFFNILRTKSH